MVKYVTFNHCNMSSNLIALIYISFFYLKKTLSKKKVYKLCSIQAFFTLYLCNYTYSAFFLGLKNIKYKKDKNNARFSLFRFNL